MMVYRYGALKPRVLDNDGAELPFETLLDYQRLSNRFYNALVEIERWRIAAEFVTEILNGDRLTEDQKNEHRLAYNADCSVAGQETTIGWGQKQAVTEMVAAAVKTRRKDEAKARRKADLKDWHWLKRVLAIPRPRYRRFDGEGPIAATVQGCSKLTVKSVLSPSPKPTKRKKPLATHVALRVVETKHRNSHAIVTLRLCDTLSLEVPIVYAPERAEYRNSDVRPLPKESIGPSGAPYDVRVIFARLLVDRIGDRWVYSVHFTIDAVHAKKPTGIGKCAVNFGWRRVPGGVRVAYAVGEDGREQSLVLPDKLFARMEHAESLRGLADEIADAYLGDGGRRAKSRKVALSSPHANHPELGKIRFTLEQAKLGSAKDAEQWARRDRHLYQWERDEYTKALRSRREIYRLWARELLTQYDSVVIETFDIRQVIERGKYEMNIPQARHYRFLVGPHYLRLDIEDVFGEQCKVLPPAKHTQTCHVCGTKCTWDRARELMHDCKKCGASWDQDANNARNQLAAAAAE